MTVARCGYAWPFVVVREDVSFRFSPDPLSVTMIKFPLDIGNTHVNFAVETYMWDSLVLLRCHYGPAGACCVIYWWLAISFTLRIFHIGLSTTITLSVACSVHFNYLYYTAWRFLTCPGLSFSLSILFTKSTISLKRTFKHRVSRKTHRVTSDSNTQLLIKLIYTRFILEGK